MKETLKKYFDLDRSLQNTETLKPIYTTLDVTSINKGILEQADNVYVIPTTFGWSDIGTWSAINEKYKYTGEDQDENHNTLLCKHFLDTTLKTISFILHKIKQLLLTD